MKEVSNCLDGFDNWYDWRVLTGELNDVDVMKMVSRIDDETVTSRFDPFYPA